MFRGVHLGRLDSDVPATPHPSLLEGPFLRGFISLGNQGWKSSCGLIEIKPRQASQHYLAACWGQSIAADTGRGECKSLTPGAHHSGEGLGEGQTAKLTEVAKAKHSPQEAPKKASGVRELEVQEENTGLSGGRPGRAEGKAGISSALVLHNPHSSLCLQGGHLRGSQESRENVPHQRGIAPAGEPVSGCRSLPSALHLPQIPARSRPSPVPSQTSHPETESETH